MFIHYRTTVLLAEVSCVVVVVSVAVVVVSVVVGCWRMKGNAYQAEMGYGRLPPLCVIPYAGANANGGSKEEMNVEACTFPRCLYFKILESTSEKKHNDEI